MIRGSRSLKTEMLELTLEVTLSMKSKVFPISIRAMLLWWKVAREAIKPLSISTYVYFPMAIVDPIDSRSKVCRSILFF